MTLSLPPLLQVTRPAFSPILAGMTEPEKAGSGHDPAPAAAEARFTRRVGVFSAGTLLSRIMGLVRESVFAYLFGAGFATDAFNVAFRIPNFFRDVFAESALSAAFVPTFVQSLRRDREGLGHNPNSATGIGLCPAPQSWRFAANMLNTMTLVIGLLVIAGMVFAPQITRLIAHGFANQPDKLSLTTDLTRIMFPFLLFVAVAAWAMGILNSLGTFFTPAVAPAAFNLVSIIVPVALYRAFEARGLNPILGMAIGVTLGAVAQLAVQVPDLYRHGFRYRPVLDFRDPDQRRVFLRWLPVVLGLASWQLNFLINTFLLALLPEGSVTWVSYAYRIQHLPAGLFGAAIGSVALAEYSHQVTTDAIRDRFRHAMNLVATFTLPASAILIALAVPVTRLIYQHGRFTAADTLLTAQALVLYSLGTWSAAATRNCAAGFYSLGNTRTPAIVAVVAVAGSVGMNLGLMGTLKFLSFPLATSVAQTANFLLLFLLLRRRTQGLSGRALVSGFALVFIASVVAGLGAWLVARLFTMVLTVRSIPAQAAQVLLAGCAGLALYWLTLKLLKADDSLLALRQLVRRFSSRGG